MLPSDTWHKWAQSLQRNHLTGFTVILLEGAAPIRMLISQTLFGLTPFFGVSSKNSITAFAETLDDNRACHELAAFLRNGGMDEQR